MVGDHMGIPRTVVFFTVSMSFYMRLPQVLSALRMTNPKRRTETSGTHADMLPDLRVIQYTYPLIEASRTLHHVTSLDDLRRYARVQSFPHIENVP
jgi:hypothetical protein